MLDRRIFRENPASVKGNLERRRKADRAGVPRRVVT